MKIYDDTGKGGGDGSPPGGADQVRVGIADFATNTNGQTLQTSGLGSCVGVALFDPDAGVTGLLHVMLPSVEEASTGGEAKFADSGIEALLDAMSADGADPDNVRARIAGGSDMLDFSSIDEGIGARNVAAVRATLDRLDVPIIEEDVGGTYGRSLAVSPDGTLSVSTAGGGDGPA